MFRRAKGIVMVRCLRARRTSNGQMFIGARETNDVRCLEEQEERGDGQMFRGVSLGARRTSNCQMFIGARGTSDVRCLEE